VADQFDFDLSFDEPPMRASKQLAASPFDELGANGF